MSYARSGKAAVKPPAGAQVNWGHPLARGLEFDFSVSERSGLYTYDWAKGRRGTISNNLNPAEWWTPGLALRSVNVGTILESTLPDAPFLGGVSLVWRGIILSGGTGRHLCGKHESNGSSNNVFSFLSDDAKLYFVRANAGGFLVHEGGAGHTLNQLMTYGVATRDGNLQTVPTFYRNGAFWSVGVPNGGSGTGPVTGSNSILRIGQRADDAVRMDGILEFCRGYSRELSKDEMAWIHAEPYAHLSVPAWRRYFVSAPAMSAETSHTFVA